MCLVLTLIVGCKKIDVDFSYSPTDPKAGEMIKFTNNSSAGESGHGHLVITVQV